MVETNLAEYKLMFHYDSLAEFNRYIFDGILNINHVYGRKRCVTIDKDKIYGYFLEKNKEIYFLEDFQDINKSVLDVLPIRVSNKIETDYNRDVFYFIEKYLSVKIPSEQKLTFYDMVNIIAPFNHTNQLHWTLAKIITIAARCSRINFRFIATRGFGKDSALNSILELIGNMANIYGATYAKMEYSLNNKFVIFNEMGNLKSEDKQNMQQFLLATGGYSNKYTKRSRAVDGVPEERDISKLSLGIVYNPPIYYIEKGQEFFDTLFTRAVLDRFIPFFFEGKLNESFDAEFNPKEIVKNNEQLYKDIVSTLLYYSNNTPQNAYLVPTDDIKFGENRRRFERTFLTIARFISEYAKDSPNPEETYYKLIYELYKTYQVFDDVMEKALASIKHNTNAEDKK